MKLTEIYSVLEEVAPKTLSDEFCKKYDMYDNSGIIINCGEEISGILFSLDLSEAAVARCKELGFNLIVTHHPAIYGGLKRFDLPFDPQSRGLAMCIKSGISVISMHLNFDAAPEGIDYHLMRGLGGESFKATVNLSNGAYGRVYEIGERKLDDYVNEIKNTFSSDRTIYYGDGEKIIRRVASFCGAGTDEHNIEFAKNEKADAFVSSDMKHHEISALVSMGIAVIELTHYSSENYGFNQIYKKIKDNFEVPSDYFSDGNLL